MRFLREDVLCDLLEIGLTNGKYRIAALPLKIAEAPVFSLKPVIGDTFHFLDQFSLCDCSSKPAKHVDVVFRSTHSEGRAFQSFGNPAKLRVKFIA